MHTVILCGGKGTRIGEVTQGLRPKPMVEIGGRPILDHIMRYYYSFGHDHFVLCVGHQSWSIKSYFMSLRERHSDITLDFGAQRTEFHKATSMPNWTVTIAETGEDTMTAGRLRRILEYLPDDGSFMLTYGDGLADVDLDALMAFHRDHGRGLTMTGVIPPGRFGEIVLEGDRVAEWAEKPQQSDRYINGGFMVMRRDFAERYIAGCDDTVMLERAPFERAARDDEIMMFRHRGFWQCMDTMRDWQSLNGIWQSGEAPWARRLDLSRHSS